MQKNDIELIKIKMVAAGDNRQKIINLLILIKIKKNNKIPNMFYE